MDAIRSRIAEAIMPMRVVNTHEHAWQSFTTAWAVPFDLPSFFCLGYVAADLSSAGLQRPPDLFDYLVNPACTGGPEQAWETVRPFAERVRNTTYFRYLLAGMQELFGVSEADIFSDRWQTASAKIRQFSIDTAGCGADLCRRMNVTITIIDSKLAPKDLARTANSEHRILHVARVDDFIIEARGLASTLEQYPARSLDEWLSAFDQRFQEYLNAGVAGFKSGLAYNRPIEYGDPAEGRVATIFRKGILTASPSEKAMFQDFMMNRLCRKCIAAEVPLQIHTGIQAGNWSTLEDARPTALTSLFQRHRDLRVDLFHGGYPWIVQAGIMAKYFPNVHINGCWLNSISACAYKEAFRSWIQTVPLSKIFAWGGDSFPLLEHSYASLLGAKRILADLLAELVHEDYFDFDLAIELARRALHDNPADFWRLKSSS